MSQNDKKSSLPERTILLDDSLKKSVCGPRNALLCQHVRLGRCSPSCLRWSINGRLTFFLYTSGAGH